MNISLGLCCMKTNTKMKKGVVSPKSFDLTKVKMAAIHNIDTSIALIQECLSSKCFFRISSNLIPFYDMWDWQNDRLILAKLAELKAVASELSVFTMHPDQFIVLSSLNEDVRQKSIKLYEYQCHIASIIGCTDVIIHIGRTKGADTFKKTFYELSDTAKQLTRVENCHHNSAQYTIDMCNDLGIPFILDVHHARLTGETEFSSDLIKATYQTWKGRRPIAHISSGKTHDMDKSHADMISKDDIKKFLWLFDLFHVEVEAKLKEKAIVGVHDYLLKLISAGNKINS